MINKIAIIAGSVLLATACGTGNKGSGGEAGSAETVEAKIKVTLPSSAPQDGFALQGGASFSDAEVTGCVSGYEVNGLSDLDTSVPLLVGDADCTYRINTISAGGDTFAIPAGFDFSTNSEYLKAGAGSNKVLRLRVTDQLPKFPSFIASGSNPPVTIDMSFIDRDDSETATLATTSAGVSVNVDEALALDISVATTEIDPATGGAALEITLNCFSAVGADDLCGQYDNTTLIGALATQASQPDLANGTTDSAADAGDLDACLALAQSGSNPSATYQQADASPYASMGGALYSVTGPGPLYGDAGSPDNSSLVFAVAPAGAQSCKYFLITINNPL